MKDQAMTPYEAGAAAMRELCAKNMLNPSTAEGLRALPLPTDPASPKHKFKVGDKVQKLSGYRFPGIVRSVYQKSDGGIRYDVEADHPDFAGMLHIFSESQLILRTPLPTDPSSGEGADAEARRLAKQMQGMNEPDSRVIAAALAAALAARDAEIATLRAALEKAAVYVERAKLNLSYDRQDAVSSAAEAEGNKNLAYHDCVNALDAINQAKGDTP